MCGFCQENVLYDGLCGDFYVGFLVLQLFNIECVEVLKGLVGVFYGGGDVGGVINYVICKFKVMFECCIELQVGNNDFSVVLIDVIGLMNVVGSVCYCVGLYSDVEQGVWWNVDSESVIGDVLFVVDVGDIGELILQFIDIIQNLGGNCLCGVLVDDVGNFFIDCCWNYNEVSDFFDMCVRVVLVQYCFVLCDNLDVDVVVCWFSNNEYQMYYELMGLIDCDCDGVVVWMMCQLCNQICDNEVFIVNVNVVWWINIGSIGYIMLFGVDVYQFDVDFIVQIVNSVDFVCGVGLVYGIDLFNLVYGVSIWYDYILVVLFW